MFFSSPCLRLVCVNKCRLMNTSQMLAMAFVIPRICVPVPAFSRLISPLAGPILKTHHKCLKVSWVDQKGLTYYKFYFWCWLFDWDIFQFICYHMRAFPATTKSLLIIFASHFPSFFRTWHIYGSKFTSP